MVVRKLFFIAVALLLVLASCERPEPECPEEPQDLQKISVGFFRAEGLYYHPAIDTTFSSVYAAGYPAEMRGRRIDGKYYLPVPSDGGKVLYVFEQGAERDTLALELKLELDFEDTYCPPVVRISEIKLLPELTSYPAESIKVYGSNYYYNETSVRIYLP